VPALGLRTRAVEFGNKVGLKSAQGPWGLIKVRERGVGGVDVGPTRFMPDHFFWIAASRRNSTTTVSSLLDARTDRDSPRNPPRGSWIGWEPSTLRGRRWWGASCKWKESQDGAFKTSAVVDRDTLKDMSGKKVKACVRIGSTMYNSNAIEKEPGFEGYVLMHSRSYGMWVRVGGVYQTPNPGFSLFLLTLTSLNGLGSQTRPRPTRCSSR
jgi:hypothetical protein